MNLIEFSRGVCSCILKAQHCIVDEHVRKCHSSRTMTKIQPRSVLLLHPRNVSQGSALQSLAQEESAEVQSLTKSRDFCTRAVHQSKRQKKPSQKETSIKAQVSVFYQEKFKKISLDQPFLQFHATENASDVTSYLFPAAYYFCLPSWELWGQQIGKIQR